MPSIRSKGERLYLVATLPIKDGSPGRKQYKLALHLPDTVQGKRKAAIELKRLERSLLERTFDWADWAPDRSDKRLTWRKAIDQLHDYRVSKKRTKEQQWVENWLPYLSKAPIRLNNPCTSSDIAKALAHWDRGQQQYEKAYRVFTQLTALSGIPFPDVDVPTYELPHRRGEIKDVPSDAEIIDWILGTEDPALRWYWGVMATWGARPQEIDSCQILDGDDLQIFWGKTKFRTVAPAPGNWVDLFDLRKPVRRNNMDVKAYVWMRNALRRRGLDQNGWTSYSLRHAYAGRLWRLAGPRMDIYTAARMMGHSTTVHEQTYRNWVEPHTIAHRAKTAMAEHQEDQQQRLRQALLQPDRT